MDFQQQVLIFNPEQHGYALGPVCLIGCGAIGSATLLTLGKMGCHNVDIYDFDKVETHNLCNQALFGPQDVGEPKARAAWSNLRNLVGPDDSYHALEIAFRPIDLQNRYNVVICATDDLVTRETFWNASCEYFRRVGLPRYWIDLRMGGQQVQRYVFDLREATTEQLVDYEATLREADDDACGARSFFPTAQLAASLAGLAIAAIARGDKVPWDITLDFALAAEPVALADGMLMRIGRG